MTTLAVIDKTGTRLPELADVANSEHNATVSALSAAVEHAIRCGQALNEACELTGVQGWHSWVETNLQFTVPHAGRYMRLAFYKDQLPPEILRPFIDKHGHTRQPSIARALNYVRGLPAIRPTTEHRRISEPVRTEAKRLRKAGLTYAVIAEMLGISDAAAAKICNPEAYQRYVRQHREQRRRLKAAHRELTRQEEQRNHSRAGGAVADTYSLIRRAAQRADDALGSATTSESRLAVRSAIKGLHEAEDAIVQAMKLGSTSEAA